MAEKRLRPKYTVQRVEEGALRGNFVESTDPDNVNSPFVLMPRKDPSAFAAVITYARYCEPQLANEIKAWLRKIAEAEPIFGTQGTRNLQAMRMKSTLDILT